MAKEDNLVFGDDTLIDFYQLFVQDVYEDGETLYFVNERVNPNQFEDADGNDLTRDGVGLTWAGNFYHKLPFKLEGASSNSFEKLARPTIEVSNIFNDYSFPLAQAINPVQNLVGARLNRYRVWSEFIDGQTNSNPEIYYGPERYIVNSLLSLDRLIVKFQLVSILDIEKITFPIGRVTKNLFKGAGQFAK